MWDPARQTPQRRVVRVLGVDPDLGVDLDPETLRRATEELAAPLVRIEWPSHRGRWGPPEPAGTLGLLIVDGLFLREVEFLSTFSAEVLGQGDLLRPWDVDGEPSLPVPVRTHWIALAPVRLALLNAPFLRRAVHYPDVLGRLIARGIGRAKALSLHDAITNLKHVEARLLVQFWHLAERWGRVGPDSISIPVPLTHEMLAKLVGATRPTVTTGLGRLAARGLLARKSRTWQLSHDSADALGPMPLQPETQLTA